MHVRLQFIFLCRLYEATPYKFDEDKESVSSFFRVSQLIKNIVFKTHQS